MAPSQHEAAVQPLKAGVLSFDVADFVPEVRPFARPLHRRRVRSHALRRLAIRALIGERLFGDSRDLRRVEIESRF